MGQTGLLKQITTNRQSFSAFVALTVMMLSLILSTFASAAVLQERSIVPSTASVTAEEESVRYLVTFTPEVDAGALVLDFCTNTPVIGQSCTAPVGMDLSGADSEDADTITGAANRITLTGDFDEGVESVIEISDLTNPTSAGAVFVRMLTYEDGVAAALYESDDPFNADLDPDEEGAAIEVLDTGSVTMLFNNDVAVQGTVLESMTFCVSGSVIEANCTGLTAPAITLGQDVGGGIIALQAGVVSQGTLHTQMNTNALHGAVVRLRSSAICGGLMRLGSDACEIQAALDQDVLDDNNEARFGLKLGALADAVGAANPSGTLQAYDSGDGAYYTDDSFNFFYDNTHTTGVTSVFGDPILDTDGGPASGKNIPLIFGATIATDTPAGSYSTDLNLIAVGKF